MTEEEERNLLGELDAADWSTVRDAVERAGDRLRKHQVDELLRSELASRFLHLSSNPKWEVRKAVAHAVLFLRHDAFHAIMARIVDDENAWVKDAARKTLQRRGELTRTDIHGENHGDTISGLLSSLEARYGLRVRRAVLSVADQLNHRFVREAYHEVVRIISPLDASLLNLDRELADAPCLPNDRRENIRRMRARVQLIPEFLDNLRAFTTRTQTEFSSESLRAIIDEAVELAFSHTELPTGGVDLQLQIDESLKLDADRSSLLQAFINIIVNGIEACAENSRSARLIISAISQTDSHIKISITDNGCGMNEEALRDCVLLYSSGKPNGMGFGLPLAKKIIEIGHGGVLSIESKKDQGTTATIVLPVEQTRSQE